MPRYYFHVQDGRDFVDNVGSILTDADAARVEAVAVAGEHIKDYAEVFWTRHDWRLEVVDEEGTTICKLRFAPMTE